MLKTILLVAAGALAALLAYAAFKPDTVRLSRSATVAAPPDRVFALINDLRRVNEWNPFAKLDPHNAVYYEDVIAGAGGVYPWQGENSGAGRMQITESLSPRRVTAKLDFSKPFEAHKLVEFTVNEEGDCRKGKLSFPLAEALHSAPIRRAARQGVREQASTALGRSMK